MRSSLPVRPGCCPRGRHQLSVRHCRYRSCRWFPSSYRFLLNSFRLRTQCSLLRFLLLTQGLQLLTQCLLLLTQWHAEASSPH